MVSALVLAAYVAGVAAPGYEWHTIHSTCCDIHYPRELEHVARRVANIADESVANASEFLKSAPAERVQVVLHDTVDSPNGFTNVVPYDIIDLHTITPEGDSDLAVTDEYLRLLIQHEIMHVVHLDTIHGLPAVVNLVVGKVWPPNLVQPRFVVEGLAVFGETRFTTKGRLRSTLFKTDLLIAALEGDLWQLDDLSSYSRRNPGGGGAYAYGAEFVAWLAAKYGADIWPAEAHDYGGTVIPFAVQRSIEGVTGHSVEDDYQLFLDDVRAQAHALQAAAVARGGPTKARRLTRIGGAIRRPVFDRDGSVVVGADVPNGVAGLFRIDGLPAATPRLAPMVRTTEADDVAVVGDTIVVAQTETTRGFYSFHDLYRVEGAGAAGGDGARLVRITREARVRAPSPIPGTRKVVAEQRAADSAALVVVDVDSGAVTDLVRADDGTLWYTPDVSPDGEHVVASRWSPGGARQIVEIDMRNGAQRVLTDDGAQNLEPTYAADAADADGADADADAADAAGAWVLYSSDREGMFSIYAVARAAPHEVRRIVDSLGLAKSPRATPDGRAVLYVDTHLDGNDLYAADLDIAHAPVVTSDAAPAPAVTPPTAEALPEDVPDERYNAFGTLLPHYYVPLVGQDAAGGPALGVAVVGEDAVGQLSFSAQASYGFAIGRPHFAGAVRIQDSPLPVTVSAEWRTNRSDRFRRTDGLPDVQQETVFAAAGSFSVPVLRSRRYSHSLSIGYSREFHVVENPLTSPPDARAPVYPPSFNIGALTLDWGYAGIESYRDSVSNERGFTSFVHLRHADRLTFSEQDITEVIVDARNFLPVPGLGGHVVGIYLSGGVAFGDKRVRDNFFLGGFVDRDITRDLLNGSRSGGGVLRGYPQGITGGDAFTLATLEYRLPLLEVEQGVSTLPLFLDRVHGAVFTDMGMGFDGAPVPTTIRASVGAELRIQFVLAYYGLFIVRAGYARGVSQDGVDQPYVVLGFPY